MKAAARQVEDHTDRENARVLAEYRQQASYVKGAKNYWSSCLDFITMISSNIIHAIAEPSIKIKVKMKVKKYSNDVTVANKLTDLRKSIK